MVPPQQDRLKFEFPDGLRAVAALLVALYHTYIFTKMTGDSSELPILVKVIVVGDFAVPVFIVLSGFVLMLPVAARTDSKLRGGFGKYIYRRARRILPPYFASLLIFGVMILLVPVLQQPSGTAWDSKVPVTIGGVISHALVVHNFSPDWIYQINGPAWSIATEWQLYFFLPLLILPLWRKFGGLVTVVVCVILGCLTHFVAPALDSAHLWFLGLFAMGAFAANTVVNRAAPVRGLGVALAIAAPPLIVVLVLFNSRAQDQAWITETVLGILVSAFLVWLGQGSKSGKRSWAHKVLESRPLVWGGLWSYSAYLIHSPLLALGNFILLPLELPLLAHFGIMVFVVLPLALSLAFLFHLVVERHFMTSHQRRVVKDEKLVAYSV